MKKKIKNIKFTKKQMIIAGVVVVALAVGGFIIVKKKNSGMDIDGEMAMGPELYTIPGKEKIFVNGKIVPSQSKDFFVDGEKGELDQIKVENGKKVDKGAPLFTCKNENSISELNEVKDNIAKKQKEKKNTTDEELKKSIDEEISELNKQVSKLEKTAYTTVYAPFTGKVYINESTENSEQTPSLMTLETEEFYIKGQASEQDLSKISLSQELEILVYSTKEKYSGKITAIGERPSTDQNNDMMMGNQNMSYYDIKISFDEGQDLSSIKNGFHVQNTIEVSTAKIKIPYTALKQEDGQTVVFKIIDGIIYKQPVVAEETTEEYAVVTEGIAEEDEIIRYADDESIKEGESIYPGEETMMEGEAEIVE